MRKAASYLRVSTDDQPNGLQGQRAELIAYSRAHNIRIVKEFAEQASGTDDNRPIVANAKDYCKKNHLLLMSSKVDRLCRSEFFMASLYKQCVEFMTLDNPTRNKFLNYILAAIAEEEAETISSRTKAGLRIVKSKGVKLGTNGKKLARYFKRKRMALIKRVKPKIIKLRKLGYSYREIAAEFNRKGEPTFSKAGHWHVNTVYNVMHERK